MHWHPTEEIHDYLDGRLTASERAALDSHLQECVQCRKELEALRWTKESLRGTIGTQSDTAVLMAKLRAVLNVDESVRSRRNGLKWAAASLLLIAGASTLFYLLRGHDPIAAVINDYRNYRSGQLQLQVRSQEPAVVASFFESQGIAVRSEELELPDYRLVGAEMQEMNDRRNAVYVYQRDTEAVLVCDMHPGNERELPAGAVIHYIDGAKLYVYQKDSLTIVCWQRRDVLSVLVSDGTRDEVVRLGLIKASLRSAG